MKILIITPIFPPEIGGPATYTWELAHRLDEVSVIAFGDSLKPIDCAKLHQLKVRSGYARKLPVVGSVLRQLDLFFAVLKHGRKSDLIYLQGPLVVGFFGGLAAKLIHRPIVMKFVGDIAWETAHREGKTDKNLDDFLASGGGGISRMFQKSAFKRASRIVVPSQYLKDILAKHYSVPEDKVTVIYNAVEVPFINKPKREDNTKTIVTVGRLVPHKNIAGIIEALKIVSKTQDTDSREVMRSRGSRRSDIVLRIIGEGPEGTKLRQLARDLNVDKYITFLGPLSHEETLKEIARADMLVLNSIYEGLPHTVVEAMYLRTPVLATDIPGTREVATIQTAVLTKPNNPQDLARNIKATLTIDNTEEAYRFVSENFNWEKNLEQLQEVFSSTKK
ncbi:MAG: glycosyltransferase family 4 protein [Candidatus Gracilibacteria bacterium]|jgi:glycosyltransferase involved in cell wall biosynthesis